MLENGCKCVSINIGAYLYTRQQHAAFPSLVFGKLTLSCFLFSFKTFEKTKQKRNIYLINFAAGSMWFLRAYICVCIYVSMHVFVYVYVVYVCVFVCCMFQCKRGIQVFH